jgi:surface carbohydrate biosynthesis protein (TIGR04326 family)
MTSTGRGPLILGVGSAQDPADGLSASWTEYLVDPAVVSIPAAVECWADELREEYLSWVYELGLRKIRGRSIRSRLHLPGGLSYWWMTLIPEKASLKTPSVYAALKIAALRRVYEEHGCSAMVNRVPNRELHRVLRAWCREIRHPYTWAPHAAVDATAAPLRRMWNRRPHVIRALETLRQHRHRRAIVRRCPGLRDVPARFTEEATIVTYFPNIDLEAAERGEFRSKYWGALHDLLDSLPVTVNWIWIHINSSDCSFEEAVRLRDLCNRTNPGKNRHFLLEEFAAEDGLAPELTTFLAIVRRGLGLWGARRHFRMRSGGPPLFPIFASDWRSSFFGSVSMDAAFFLTAFDRAVQQLPRTAWGMYLWEEQPWELALLHAWRRWRPETRTIGFQHSSFGPMLLRMFDDRRRYLDRGWDSKPLMDILAVNGGIVRRLMQQTGFPKDRLADVEAVRYQYLVGEPIRERGLSSSAGRTLLVAGSFQSAEVSFLLRLLREAAGHGALNGYSRLLLKAHPFCPIRDKDLAEIGDAVECEITSSPLPELWPQADAVLAANSTTAALEALCARVPVAVCSAGDGINLSALFGHPEVPMISAAQDLSNFLRSPGMPADAAGLFNLDPKLRLWSELLAPGVEPPRPSAMWQDVPRRELELDQK